MGKHECLTSQIDDQIDRFGCESKKHKIMHRRFRYLIFGLTGISTMLAGVSLTYPTWHTELSLGVLIVTAVIALVTSIDGVHKPGELWIHERGTFYQLKDIKRAFEYHASKSDQPDCSDTYFEQMQAVLGSAGEKWQRQIVAGKKEPVQTDT
jgi:hypothetical protein